ncbi:MAG: hypothetical protein J2P15_16650 [Micromonosporaceae bacterium]|nr:hypothetical protein [Micromonosporaceae bacterium]
MGLLDRFGGSPRDRFARQVMAAARAQGVAEVRYDPERFAVIFRVHPGGDNGTIFLANVFRECQGADADERKGRIASLVNSLVAPEELLDVWSVARPALRPVLRVVTYALDADRRQVGPLARPVFPFVQEMVVVDQPTSMMYVTQDRARDWGVPVTEIFDTARANLERLAGPPPDLEPDLRGNAVLRFVEDGEAYFVSRLLLDGWLSGLAPHVGGRPVAFIPDHNTLVVTADAPESIGELLAHVEKWYTDAVRPISPQAYTVDPYGKVVPYPAAEDHPAATAVHRSELVLASSEYASQQNWLRDRYERDAIDVFVATYTATAGPDGSVSSYSVWGEGVDTLLPRAEFVRFVDRSRNVFTVSWSVLEREVDLEPEADLVPERYRLRSWPPPGVIERLRARAVTP